MVKVLKSFDSAHSAVNWMSQNRIEDTSIETTGTLKSMGMGRIPSGNYHVVLKNVLTQLPPGDAADVNAQRPTLDPKDAPDNRWRDSKGTQARALAENELLDVIVRDAQSAGLAEGDTDVVARIMGPRVSKKSLVDIITKSVIDVLKGLGMGVLSREALRDTENEFEEEAGRYGAMIDANRIPQAQEAINKEAESLLARRPGDETRAARVAEVLARAQRRLDTADEIQNLITNPDGGEPREY